MKQKEVQKEKSLVLLEDKSESTPKEPKMCKVLMMNDDITPMDFVIQVLKVVFYKSDKDAVSLMLYIHNSSSGLCGTYTRDIAETKVLQAEHMAQTNNYPLKCIVEEE